MSIHIDTKKKNGQWKFTLMAGEDGDLEEYAASDYEFDTEHDAEVMALYWIIDEWELIV